MNHKFLKPRQALNKAFLKVKPVRTQIEVFKGNLIRLFDQINESESEEFHKNLVSDFLKRTYYEPDFSINTKGRNDMVIHNGKDAKSPVGVILETKKPTNRAEMLSLSPVAKSIKSLNVKSFQELILYFLRERITQNNLEVKHLVVTNIYEWFVFDAAVFEKAFAQNKTLVKDFKAFEEGRLSGNTTDFFYKEIASREIDKLEGELPFTYFDLRNYDKPLRNADKKDDVKLIALFKLLSPEHMLKLPFSNDSNNLDKRFYSELLHIIGLTETKEGGKKLIGRNKEGERNTGSILEDTIIQLDSLDKISRLTQPSQFGKTHQERLFNVALELSITWINRILFLKLLEAQLFTYHKGDKSYSFLSLDKIKNYDDLNSLFFQVLARKFEDRNPDVKALFEKVPYLNSSLFEPTEIEQVTLFISNLRDDKLIPIISSTVLKNEQGKKRTGKLSTLEYLFEFLNAYDFSSEGSEDIQEDNKTLINASVLGLIFEKINGYKDGSFFTPGFITMYMCRETIRRAVVQKFKEAVNITLTPRPPLPKGEGENSQQQILRSGKVPSPSGRGDLGVRDIELQGKKVDPKVLEFARNNRKEATQAESFLWEILRNRKLNGLKFRRQHPIKDKYILDFYCAEERLVIEIDGGYHHEADQKEYDEGRSFELNELELNVIRFTNQEVLFETERVLQEILDSTHSGQSIGENTLTPRPPLPDGEGVKVSLPTGRGDLGVRVENLDDVYDLIGPGGRFSYKQANKIVNSIKICDPAVGSGHFLVSALNEMIAVKNDLKILQDRNGKRLKEYHVEVVNDELIVTDEEGELFEYNPSNKESQRIQETLFHEKQTIIENCLFGVDINPNSVKICRLRLWIELLKNAYYKNATELETLPNIDINIKCGNSLVSRFAIDADLSEALKKSKFSIDSYRMAVTTYRNAQNKEEKREMERLIAEIKSDFRSEIANNDPKIKKKAKLGGELYNLTMQTGLFEVSAKEKKERKKKVEKIEAELEKLSTEIDEIKNNKIYENAFEWRFEFPEVLNETGDFVGFDVVIGNPPYIRQEEFSELKPYLKTRFEIYHSLADLLTYFVELSQNILKQEGVFQFIISGKFTRAGYGNLMRKFLSERTEMTHFIDFGGKSVFDEATVDAAIIGFLNKQPSNEGKLVFKEVLKKDNVSLDFDNYIKTNATQFPSKALTEDVWSFDNPKWLSIIEKINKNGIQLSAWDITINFGIKTGYNEAFIIDKATRNELIIADPKSDEIIKPLLRGRDIQKYVADDIVNWVIGTFPSKKIDIDEYLAIKNYLESFGKTIHQTGEKGSRKKTSHKWFETQDNIAFWKDFEKPKLVWKRIGSILRFCYDDSGAYCLDSTCIATGSKVKFLSAVLNSKMCNKELFRLSPKTGTGDLIISVQALNPLRIPIPSEDQESEICLLLDKILKVKKQNPAGDTSDLENQIDQLVYELYGLTEEEIRIVEGGDL